MIAGIATATNAKVLANFAATIKLTAAAVGVAQPCYFEEQFYEEAFLNFERVQVGFDSYATTEEAQNEAGKDEGVPYQGTDSYFFLLYLSY